MIVITGATGALNGATTDHLLEHVDPEELVVVARDPAKAARFADRGVEVRRGDYAEPETLPAAFAGADQLLLVSSSDPTADAVALHRAAVDAAVAAEVGHVLYTSHQGAAHSSPFRPGADHAATEDLLRASGLRWTSLRNGFYAHSTTWLMGPWRQTGTVSVPADGPVSWTAREDAAEAAARILLDGRPADGPLTLTAPEAPTFADLARLASETTDRPVGFEVLGEDAWRDRAVASGQDPHMVGFLLGMYQAAAAGTFAGTDPLLGGLLGRAPRSVRDQLA
ncbi:NAD(P)H-binding protein [Curtobacterium sp. L1-20]|uniref:NAD(P)H-binding protein n=1 Tax=Curtobacterium sp. L1-20 TaxID=3138181 RepID=UPI003B525801